MRVTVKGSTWDLKSKTGKKFYGKEYVAGIVSSDVIDAGNTGNQKIV